MTCNAQRSSLKPSQLVWSQAWTFSQTGNSASANLPKAAGIPSKLENAAKRLYDDLQNGALPFVAMDYVDDLITETTQLLPFLYSFKHMLLLGIGGSALGARALQKAFYPQQDWPCHPQNNNERSLWIADNIDPESLPDWFERLPPEETLVLVISKSGGTIETMSQYFLAKQWLQEKLGTAWKKHLLLVTDQNSGFLRAEAKEFDIRSMPVPQNLGGRYSVLSAVGIVPAAFLGLDWKNLLCGAQNFFQSINAAQNQSELETVLASHPAWNMAVWANSLMDTGYNELIFFTYVPKLAAFGQWFAQLWAESLGKNGLGSMPLPAVGVTDQHSLQQMFLDGPRNKACIFLSGSRLPAGLYFPDDLSGKWEFLKGKNLADLLAAETLGTRLALTGHKVPLLEMRLADSTEYTVGRMMALLGLATIFTGWLMGINPLDQPAVELGKRLANASLGADKLEEEKSKLAEFAKLKDISQNF